MKRRGMPCRMCEQDESIPTYCGPCALERQRRDRVLKSHGHTLAREVARVCRKMDLDGMQPSAALDALVCALEDATEGEGIGSIP